MFSRLRRWPYRMLSGVAALLPSSCALCGSAQRGTLCDECRSQYFSAPRTRCRCCAIPLQAADDGQTCGGCLKQPPAFDATIVATDYTPPADQLVLALKFGTRLELAPLLARLLDAPARCGHAPAVLTAVPLGPQRLAERGFNQALEIAKPLSRSLGVPLERELVVRQRDTQAQSLLHPDQRRRNVRGAFMVPAKAMALVRGRHVGVVDDVMTTGETLNELAATLKRFGAASVTNFVFARTLQ
ncbi:MAG TPA: ComF family protein [Noviherbaspirillum sp.]|uniref:ComF family protein n=1 Tax=Noviherbaspirillum sp. TaxID=1926288 RepID=UPI002D6D8C7D|nr:ComF family protein [Noviherbaspirillum sp.]HYD96523.1 ComF family protein [Noviherbaspirillum sp.]